MENILTETADKLLQTINEAKGKFAGISASQWNEKPTQENWSRKEILGHLIDSAANNHLRFVRGQLASTTFTTHAYEQDFFVASQRYQDMPAEEIVELWYAYNRHLAHVIRNINVTKLDMVCFIGQYEPVTFSFVITDYVTHLQHHLKQVFS